MHTERLLAFSRLITAFGRIVRTTPFPGTKRFENDTEHSFHLAMTAWYLIDSRKLDLDITLVLKYALAHDLVEIYAGDTCVYSTDAEYVASKHEREANAVEKLQAEFLEFPELHSVISEYEKRLSPEARFVYALDKILPILVNYENGGVIWREKGVTLDMLKEKKADKVALSPEVLPYYEELIAILEKENIMAT